MMIETDDYWITDNKLIFKPTYNGQISDYNELIYAHKELIFSNYTDLNYLAKNNYLNILNRVDLKLLDYSCINYCFKNLALIVKY